MNDRELDKLFSGDAKPAAPGPEPIGKAKAAILGDLRPVKPIASPRATVLVLAGIALAVIALGALGLGVRGWRAMNAVQALALFGWGFTGVAFAVLAVSARMAPGRIVNSAADILYGVAFGGITTGAALLAGFEPGPKMVLAACILTVTGSALFWTAVAYRVLRRAWPVSPGAFGAACGAAAGLTGFIVVQVFCPYIESGHITASHIAPAILACAAGFLLGKRRTL